MKMIKEVLRLYHGSGLSQKKYVKLWDVRAERLQNICIALRLQVLIGRSLTNLMMPRLSGVFFRQGRNRNVRYQTSPTFTLWAEYKEEHPDGYGQTQFCDLYGRFEKSLNLVMRQEHKAGHSAFSALLARDCSSKMRTREN